MPAARTSRRRVVVTGMGCVTPLGADAEQTWTAASEARSGVGPITRFDASNFPVRFAAQAPDEFDMGDVPPKEVRRLDRVIRLGVASAEQACRESGLEASELDTTRVGVAIGTGIGGLETLQEAHRVLFSSGPRRVSPFMIPMVICNMASGYVAIRKGLRGPNLCHVGACASGAQAIGEAARAIQRGDAEVMLAGGVEAPIAAIGVAGFASMRALSTRNDAPEAASRPFDRDRDGFVMGEGGAVLVLEALEHARARGARPLGELLGYALTADAAHIAMPTEDGDGPRRCMQLALADAGLAPVDVDYLNAHATSTPAGDPSEVRAIRAVFGDHVERLAVSSTKSMTGHLLGAAGAVEALLCLRALDAGLLPPTINLEHPDPECELDHVANKARRVSARVALSNSFGFGGTNATLLLGHPDR